MSPKPGHPLKSILDIRKGEWQLALLMFSYFFLVITSFWILKPLKKSIFIQYYDQTGFQLFSWVMKASQAELLAKVLNMLVAFAAVIIFTWLVRHFKREKLTLIFCGFFVLCYVAFMGVINNPSAVSVWSFYVYGDMFNTIMVTTFFAFLNDSVTAGAAKRLYGLIVLGAVIGGVFGTSFLRAWINYLDTAEWLGICSVLAIIIGTTALSAGRLVNKKELTLPAAQPDTQEKNGNPALDGARLVFKSKYLLSIVGILGLYEVVSTIMDFQFTETISFYLDGDEIGRQFSTVYLITNTFSMIVQIFVTSFVMTRFGVKYALYVMPFAIVVASTAFLAAPILWFGSLLNTADNGLNYSINQSAREALYVPTSREEKYKAKAFIDMFIQRFAKALAVVISLGITTLFTDFNSLRWLSLITIAIVVIWLFAARYAGTRFKEMTLDSDD